MPDPNGEAEYLLNNSLLKEIFGQLEADAIERAIDAKSSDDELRRTCTQEVRAIRAVQHQLETLAKGTTKAKRRPVA